MIYGQPITFGGAGGEIDITDNGTFDVKKYATANVNVAPVLLWTNASPNSEFAAQTVTVASGYDAYLVEVINEVTEINFVPFFAGNSNDTTTWKYATVGFVTSGKGYAYIRCIYSANDGSITFGTGRYGGALSNYNNGWAIPTRIWGVKFTIS